LALKEISISLNPFTLELHQILHNISSKNLLGKYEEKITELKVDIDQQTEATIVLESKITISQSSIRSVNSDRQKVNLRILYLIFPYLCYLDA
jgi:hypothetical protein